MKKEDDVDVEDDVDDDEDESCVQAIVRGLKLEIFGKINICQIANQLEPNQEEKKKCQPNDAGGAGACGGVDEQKYQYIHI